MEPGQYSPERSVPVELIELQPSYSQAEFFAPTWMTTASVKTSHLLSRLGSLRGKKVIIFSQFQEHLRMIEEQLEKNTVSFAGLYSSGLALSAKKMKIVRAEALGRFENEESCQVLLMDGICSHGLDLSFCSNVILMEPIWDIALEEQVVSRAHRMGQKHEVQVETFVMANTVEEQVISARGLIGDPDASFSKEVNHIYELRKKKMLLSHLRTVSTRNQSKQGELQIIASPSKKINGKEAKPAETAPTDIGVSQQDEAADARRAKPVANGQPAAKKVKFSDAFEAEEEGSEATKLLSGFLSQYEEIKSRDLSLIELKATVEGAIHEQIAYQGPESLGRVYFLLVSSYWSGSKSSSEIYLLQKEKHPRYKTPRLFETAREFPDWIFSTLAKALA
jgi:superfamily II DNA or RNA helicase